MSIVCLRHTFQAIQAIKERYEYQVSTPLSLPFPVDYCPIRYHSCLRLLSALASCRRRCRPLGSFSSLLGKDTDTTIVPPSIRNGVVFTFPESRLDGILVRTLQRMKNRLLKTFNLLTGISNKQKIALDAESYILIL
jgi:hypothetical protein